MGADDICKKGVVERSMNALQDLETSEDEQIKDDSRLVQDDFSRLEKHPTPDNFNATLASLSDLQQKVNQSENGAVSKDSNHQLDQAKEELFDLAEHYGFVVDGLNNSVRGSESNGHLKSSIQPESIILHDQNFYQTTEVQNLSAVLGELSDDAGIKKVLSKLDKAKNQGAVNLGMTEFQDVFAHIDVATRKELDVEEVSKAIDDIINKNQ